jgi:hypothetical protein
MIRRKDLLMLKSLNQFLILSLLLCLLSIGNMCLIALLELNAFVQLSIGRWKFYLIMKVSWLVDMKFVVWLYGLWMVCSRRFGLMVYDWFCGWLVCMALVVIMISVVWISWFMGLVVDCWIELLVIAVWGLYGWMIESSVCWLVKE